MPRFLPSNPFSDCWSSVGDITFFHRDGVCYWKKKPYTEFAGTPAQLDQAELHHRAIESWRALDPAVQSVWNEYALAVPSHRPPFRPDHHISGYNLFVSAYHGLAQLGEERVPEPARWETFPVFHLKYLSAEKAEPCALRLSMRVFLGEVEEPSRYRVLLKLQLTYPGYGRQPGYLRNFLALSNCVSSESETVFLVEDYEKVWSVVGPSLQAHCRYLLIDTKTGYRCNFKKASFVIEL